MNAPAKLNSLGQSLWLDNITRDLLDTGTLARYIAELSVTGLTSNPTIYDKAIGGGSSYDADVRAGAAAGLDAEGIFFELALADLRRAADLFRPDPRPDPGRRRVRVARGLAPAGRRRRADHGLGGEAARGRRAAEPVHQDPGHPGRSWGHRGDDLRGRARST